jgi:hypothetical protein
MPIFSRRRIQAMLDEVRPLLREEKARDLIGRLSDRKRPEQLIAVEMELGLLWGIKQLARLKVEPEIPNSTRVPEAYSEDFFGRPSYIEVTTISDGKLSGEANMQRAAQKIVGFANSCRKGSGNKLYFSFGETSHWEGNQYFREHHVAPDFDLTEAMKADTRAWVHDPEFARTSIRLQGAGTDVTITRQEYPQKPGFNFFSSLPPLAYDIEDNPLFTALDEKREQLSGVPPQALKVIFVADGGSRLVRRLNDRDQLRQHKCGAEIVSHFLRKRDIDLVGVFSPLTRQPLSRNRRSLEWQVSYFEGDRNRIPSIQNLSRLADALPKPRFEGSQARSIQKQQGFAPSATGWYLGTEIGSGNGKITMKMSARLLLEYLAGRITIERFHDNCTGKNLFEHWLKLGYVISDARFESGGVDADDDYVILELRHDPAAAEFT